MTRDELRQPILHQADAAVEAVGGIAQLIPAIQSILRDSAAQASISAMLMSLNARKNPYNNWKSKHSRLGLCFSALRPLIREQALRNFIDNFSVRLNQRCKILQTLLQLVLIGITCLLAFFGPL